MGGRRKGLQGGHSSGGLQVGHSSGCLQVGWRQKRKNLLGKSVLYTERKEPRLSSGLCVAQGELW